MGKVLFAWELGGGAGHVGPFFPIAESLIAQGHELTVVARDLTRVTRLYQNLDVTLLQAPLLRRRPPASTVSPATYPQVLHEVGFGDLDCLTGMVRAWRSIIDLVQPNLLIADHAPGALLAVQGREMPVALLGSGFVNPPNIHPMPSVIPIDEQMQVAAQQDEERLTGTVNRVLKQIGSPILDSLGDLFSRRENTFLTTFAELDHYPTRDRATYHGSLAYRSKQMEMQEWPPGTGPRVFAYLKSSRGLAQLFDWLGAHGLPTIIVGDGLDTRSLQEITTPNMVFLDTPVPMAVVSRECDIAVLNATHGATCSVLLAGKPILQLPHTLEQAVTAQRTCFASAERLALSVC